MNVLVDTSVWSEALRRSRRSDKACAAELRALIGEHRVAIIGPIRQELLSGVRDESQFRRLADHLAAFPDTPLATDDYVEAARIFNACRSKGVHGSNTDFLICAVSLRQQFSIYTTDKDFTRFAQHLPIVLHAVRETL